MADETPAPLSDAEIAAIANHYFEPSSAAQWAEIRERVFGTMTNLEYYDDAPHIVVRLLATLAECREIVAAVANGWSNALGTRIGETRADGLALKARARALLGTPAPGTTGATAGEDGEA